MENQWDRGQLPEGAGAIQDETANASAETLSSTPESSPLVLKEDMLTASQAEVIHFFISPKSITGACRRARISEPTYRRWMRECPAWRRELALLREECVQDAVELLKMKIGEAIEGLVSLSHSKKDHIRLLATTKIIQYFLELRGIVEVEKKFETLEELVTIKKRAVG